MSNAIAEPQIRTAGAGHSGGAVIGVVDGHPLIVGDGLSIAERLLHGARAGEIVLSKPIMDALAAAGTQSRHANK